MLKIEDTLSFVNGLLLAGLKPFSFIQNFQRATAEDLLHRFSYASPEELKQVCEILKGGTHWPTYRDIEEELKSLRRATQAQDEPLLEDAYPEGAEWERHTKERFRQEQEGFGKEFSRTAWLNLHCYLQSKQQCIGCNGKNCSYNGHRPNMRLSENQKEIYLGVEKDVCSVYARQHVDAASLQV